MLTVHCSCTSIAPTDAATSSHARHQADRQPASSSSAREHYPRWAAPKPRKQTASTSQRAIHMRLTPRSYCSCMPLHCIVPTSVGPKPCAVRCQTTVWGTTTCEQGNTHRHRALWCQQPTTSTWHPPAYCKGRRPHHPPLGKGCAGLGSGGRGPRWAGRRRAGRRRAGAAEGEGCGELGGEGRGPCRVRCCVQGCHTLQTAEGHSQTCALADTEVHTR